MEWYIRKLGMPGHCEAEMYLNKKIASLGSGETSSPLLWMLFFYLTTVSLQIGQKGRALIA